MKQFKFRLESALRLRHLRLEQERSALQALMAQQQRLRRALEGVWQERTEAAEYVRGAENPGAQDVRALALFSLGVKARAQRIEEAIADLEIQIDRQKQTVLEAEREERSLEKLRDKRFAEWNMKTAREIEAGSQELWLAAHTNTVDDRSGD